MADTSLVFNILAKDKTGKTFDKISRKATVAFAAVGAGVAAFGASSVRAATTDQKGQAVLANTLKKSTGARDSDVASTEAWISSMTLATGVADDKLRPALGTLVRSTGDTAEAQSLLSTAMDISAATGKPLETVAVALAKAHNGNAGALGRLGLSMKGADGKALSFKDSVKKLNGQFGGSQLAAQKTFAGQTQILSNRFEETKETVGYALLPVLMSLMGFITNTAIPALSTFGGWVVKNKSWLIPLVAVIGTAVGVIYLVSKALKAWAVIQLVLDAALTANPIGLVVLAIVALVGGVILAYKKVGWFRAGVQAMGRFVVHAFGLIKDAAGILWGVLKTVFKWSPYGIIIDHFGTIVKFFKGIPGKIGKVVAPIADALTWPFRTAFNAIVDLWNATLGGFSIGIPSWVPKFGGNSFTLPSMPHLYKGGVIPGSAAGMPVVAGDRNQDEVIAPLSSLRGMLGGEQVVRVIVEGTGILSGIRKEVRVRGGGDVQVAFGGR